MVGNPPPETAYAKPRMEIGAEASFVACKRLTIDAPAHARSGGIALRPPHWLRHPGMAFRIVRADIASADNGPGVPVEAWCRRRGDKRIIRDLRNRSFSPKPREARYRYPRFTPPQARRRKLSIDFEVTHELKTRGATDFLAVPLFFASSGVHGATFATQQPGGSRMPRLPPFNPLSLHWPALPRIACWSASVLLDTYVGNNAGPRILGGQIRRGDTSTINAAIWLSDMRGFTRLADRLPPQTLVDMLNRYFDCQVPAIAEQGGEVLKFIGDVHGRSLDWRRRVIQQNSQCLVLPAEVGFGSWLCQNAFPERAHFGEAAMRAISGFD